MVRMENPFKQSQLNESDVREQRSENRGWLIAVLMVLVGSALLALVDARNWTYDEIVPILVGFVGWGFIFGSAFAVRHLGKKLLLYIPGVWLLSAFTVASLVIPMGNLFQIQYLVGDCGDVNHYLDGVEDSGADLNIYIASIQSSSNASDVNEAIQETRSEVARLETMDVPEDLRLLHAERINLYNGWVDVFAAHRDGRLTQATLVDLQVVDDEFERLFREAAQDCS